MMLNIQEYVSLTKHYMNLKIMHQFQDLKLFLKKTHIVWLGSKIYSTEPMEQNENYIDVKTNFNY